MTDLIFEDKYRIAEKKDDLVGKENIGLKAHENIIEYKTPKDNRTYYISLENKDDYSLDYSSGSIQKLEFMKENKVKINKK